MRTCGGLLFSAASSFRQPCYSSANALVDVRDSSGLGSFTKVVTSSGFQDDALSG